MERLPNQNAKYPDIVLVYFNILYEGNLENI